MFSNSFEVVTHSSDFKPPYVGSSFVALILSSTGASCVAGSGEQTSAAGFDGAGNEFGPSSATCRGADVLPACGLMVTRHTLYAAGDGSCPRDVENVGASGLVYAGETTTVHVVSAMLVFLVGRGVWAFLLAVVLVLVLSRAFPPLLRPGSAEMCLFVVCTLHVSISTCRACV